MLIDWNENCITADDLVLLAPSWHALQLLLNILNSQCCLSDLTYNTRKTICMIFVPKNRQRMFSTNFSSFKLGSYDLRFVSQLLLKKTAVFQRVGSENSGTKNHK